MTRNEIIKSLKKYFKIHELVGKELYAKHGDESWFVFETDALHCLLLIRVGLGRSMYLNNWFWGGNKDERGFRSNIQYICKKKTDNNVLYVSGHPLGNAFDFIVKGMIAEDVRDWIVEHADIFPCKIRLEWKKNGKPIKWTHIDTKWFSNNPKVYKFNI